MARPPFDPGSMRHRLTIQRLIAGRNRVNVPVDTYEDVATVWAAIEPLEGRELYASRQLSTTTTHRITVRGAVAGPVNTKCRLRMANGRAFNVDSARRLDERDAYLVIDATERIP